MKCFLGLLIVWAASPLFASAVSTTCSPVPTPSANQPSSWLSACTGSDSLTGAEASAVAQATFTFSHDGGLNGLHIEQHVSATFGAFPGAVVAGVGGSATSSISYSGTFLTAGPLRAGYLELVGSASVERPDNGQAGLTISMSPFDASLPTPALSCGLYGCSLGYYSSHPLVPFTLGTSFTLTASGSLFSSASFLDGSSEGSQSADFGLRLFEADGVTPVALSEVPEPSSLALFGLSLGVFLMKRKRVSTHP